MTIKFSIIHEELKTISQIIRLHGNRIIAIKTEFFSTMRSFGTNYKVKDNSTSKAFAM